MSKPVYDYHEPEDNRLWGALGYLIFFIPLLIRPSSRFYRFCANQGLLILLVKLVCAIAFGLMSWLIGWIPLIGWVISVAKRVVDLAIVLAMVYYGFQAYSGAPTRLPVIGGLELIR